MLLTALGFTCAVINNFYLNLKWTFQVNGQNTNVYFIKFIFISIVGLGLNNMFVYIFNERLKLNFYGSKALAVLCVFVWNFTANNYFNFHNYNLLLNYLLLMLMLNPFNQ